MDPSVDKDQANDAMAADVENALANQQPFEEPTFMRSLDLEAMHAPEFSQYINAAELPIMTDGEFTVEMEFSSREVVIKAMKDYTIRRGVDYRVHESEPTTFYAKCTQYDVGCDWLMRVSKMSRKYRWEIKRYNGSHTCTRATITQDHSKLDTNTIAKAIKPLVEVDPSIKVKSVIVEVQSKFNYTKSYHKAWLVKQKGDDLVPNIRVLHRVFWSYYPCIRVFKHCKPIVLDGNNNIMPIEFAIVEGETSEAHRVQLLEEVQGSVSAEAYRQHRIFEDSSRVRDALSAFTRAGEAYTNWLDRIPREQYTLAFDGDTDGII
ncbi:uncharacterized protein LOC110266788 [Arachis ipaensis]|uniref:uncharacterized protein LOC110266788 n=1 Tax=Arachis ipaensis TaxID=130454 RepID=UPI000A2AF0DC|nr:uncharacterized protein LOC110266788 [Arachis ipaensis]XP_025678248.1 uncharacterized protein LOC112778100 [Arachis hypogaea]